MPFIIVQDQKTLGSKWLRERIYEELESNAFSDFIIHRNIWNALGKFYQTHVQKKCIYYRVKLVIKDDL